MSTAPCTARAAPAGRWRYYRRILSAYVGPGPSHLSFWHDTPEVNENAPTDRIGEYYMPFTAKADYAGPFDPRGVPLLDYRGAIGVQYNPIAIAQYGLGNYNLYSRTGARERYQRFLAAAAWLVDNLEPNSAGVHVWNHRFDWEYRTPLRAPWYSGLAQGQGISLLVRAHRSTGDLTYLHAAQLAFAAFLKTIEAGGVMFVDGAGNRWVEEYIVSPPTHILNGFIWASWGIYDYGLATGDLGARKLFNAAWQTIAKNISSYDTRYWSLYEQAGVRLKMLASPFYHRLHIAQLRVLHRLTGDEVFCRWADRWESYARSPIKRTRALAHKSIFKLLYY